MLVKHLLNLRTVQIFNQLDSIFQDPDLLKELLGEHRAARVKTGWGTSSKKSGGLFWTIYDSTKNHLAFIWRNNQFWLKIFVAEFDPAIVFPIHQALTSVAKHGAITLHIDNGSVDIYYEVPISLWLFLNKNRLIRLVKELLIEVRVSFAEQAMYVLHRNTVPEAYAEQEFDLEDEEVEED